MDVPYLPIIPDKLVKENNLNIGPLTVVKYKNRCNENSIVRKNNKNKKQKFISFNKNIDAITAGILVKNNKNCRLNRFIK